MTLRPLRITDPTKQVAVLNRWADEVALELEAAKKRTFNAVQTAIKAIPPTPTVTGKDIDDGLVHGDAIWALDPAWIILRDDFNNPNAIPGPPNATYGNGLNWNLVTGGTVLPNYGGPFPMSGVLAMDSTGSASNATLMQLLSGTSAGSNGFPLLDYPGWKLVWIFQIARNNSASPTAFSWTQVSNYVGLGSYVNNGISNAVSPRPPYFIGLRYDTDTTAPAISDTQFIFEFVNNFTNTTTTRINTQGTTVATGITVTEGNIYRFEMSCVTSGQIQFFLTDGTTIFTNTMTITPPAFTASTISYSNSQGETFVTFGSVQLPIELGTKVNIASSTIANGNGNFVHQIPRGVTNELAYRGLAASGNSFAGTVTLYPGVAPFFSFGNDSQAAPVAHSKGVLLDYFGLVWNKGLAGATSPNATLARY